MGAPAINNGAEDGVEGGVETVCLWTLFASNVTRNLGSSKADEI